MLGQVALHDVKYCSARFNHFWSFVLVMELENIISDTVLHTAENGSNVLTLFDKNTGCQIADINCSGICCIIGGRCDTDNTFLLNDFSRVVKL